MSRTKKQSTEAAVREIRIQFMQGASGAVVSMLLTFAEAREPVTLYRSD